MTGPLFQFRFYSIISQRSSKLTQNKTVVSILLYISPLIIYWKQTEIYFDHPVFSLARVLVIIFLLKKKPTTSFIAFHWTGKALLIAYFPKCVVQIKMPCLALARTILCLLSLHIAERENKIFTYICCGIWFINWDTYILSTFSLKKKGKK